MISFGQLSIVCAMMMLKASSLRLTSKEDSNQTCKTRRWIWLSVKSIWTNYSNMTSHQPRKEEAWVLFSFTRKKGNRKDSNSRMHEVSNSIKMKAVKFFNLLLESWMWRDGMINWHLLSRLLIKEVSRVEDLHTDQRLVLLSQNMVPSKRLQPNSMILHQSMKKKSSQTLRIHINTTLIRNEEHIGY